MPNQYLTQAPSGGAAQTISPELQERINRFAGQSGMKGQVSNREMDALLGAQQASPTPLEVISGMKGQVSNREMDALLGAQQEPFGKDVTKPLDDFLRSTGLIEGIDLNALTSEQKLNMARTAMDMVGQAKGAISNREMELLQQTAPVTPLSDMKGQISNREMELFQQASPANFITLTNGQDTRTLRGNDPLIIELINQGYYEARIPSVIKNPDPAQELQEALEGLQIQKSQTSDPDEIKVLDRMIEAAMVGANAPLGQMAAQIQSEGRGEDTSLAHLRPGEVVLPPEAFEDEAFESVVSKKFEELGIDPEMAVSSVGIASLNPMTGLEEFGFFKKLAKGVKKVVKKVVVPIAKVAQFIPGPWQPVAALISKASTVYDVAKGRANPLALLTVAGPLRTGPSIGSSMEAIKGASTTGGGFFSGLGQSFKDMPGALASGIGSLVSDPLAAAKNVLRSRNAADYAESSLGAGDWTNIYTGEGLPIDAYGNPFTDPSQMLGRAGSGITGLTRPLQQMMFGSAETAGVPTGGPMSDRTRAAIQTLETGRAAALAAGDTDHVALFDVELAKYGPQQGGGFWNSVGEYILPGQDKVGLFGNLGKTFGGMFGGGGGQQQQLYDAQGNPVQTSSGGFMGGLGGGLGSLAMAGIPAAILAKMAYDEAKKDKGVPLTPLTTMGPTGRYNIEAEIARRMGTQTPDPVEFGLLPHGTFPELSGGRPMAAAGGGAVYPMEYANGGDVAMEDFQRMNGGINGPGTETSDDVPAMLSDGEFVFTGEAVRGAGSFDMNNQGGILTLTPSGIPDRERGTNLMHEMMDLFGSYANGTA